jgi:hypothetical protein
MLFEIVFKIHIYISALTLLTGIVTVSRSILGWSRSKTYNRTDLSFSLAFTITMYLQLLLGIVLYILLRSTSEHPFFEIPDSSNDAYLRFWAIEHIALMIFALFLSQLGRIYIRNSSASITRYKASSFYHGSALLLIFFSLSIALFFR